MASPKLRAALGLPLIAALGLSTGCRTSPAPAEPTEAPAPVEKARALAPTPEVEPISPASHPMQLLPADTLFAMEVRGWGRFAKEAGVPRVLTSGGPLSDMARVALDPDSRGVVENPERMREFGIDPEGSAGFAILSVEAESIAFWLTVSDRERLQSEFEKRVGKTLEFGGTRAGAIAAIDEDSRVVVRDNFVFFIMTEDPERADRDLARALADARPEEGLLEQAVYRDAVAGREGAAAMLFARPGAMMREFVREEFSRREAAASRMGELRWLIAQARARGASSAQLVELESELQALERDASEGAMREVPVWEQAHAFVQPMESASVAMSMKDGELRGDMRLRVPDSQALVHRLIIDLPGASAQASALDVPPMGLFEMALDPATLEPMIEAAMRADREDPDQLDQEMKSRTGVSWRDDLLGAVTGVGGGGVFFSKPPSFKRGDDLEDQLDVVAYFGVKDEAAVLASLGRFAGTKLVKDDLKPTKIKGGWRFRADDAHQIHAVVNGGHILFTSSARVAQNFMRGKPGPGMGALRRPELGVDFESGGLSARGLADAVLGLAMEARRARTRSLESFDYRFGWYRDLNPDEQKKIRMGSALKKKRARLGKLYRKYNARVVEAREKEWQEELAMAKRLGFLSGRVRELSDGFEGSLVWNFEPATLVELGMEVADRARTGGADRGSDLKALETEIQELEYQVESERFRELDRWLEKHPKKTEYAKP